MNRGIGPLWLRAVIFYVILSLLPPLAPLAMGAETAPFPSFPNGSIGNPVMNSPSSFIIPLQEEGLLDVPAIKKPWHKKWWVWGISAVLVGFAAASLSQDTKSTEPVFDPVIK